MPCGKLRIRYELLRSLRMRYVSLRNERIVADVLYVPSAESVSVCVTGASEIVTKLLGQLKIDAGPVSQEWRPALRGNLRRLCIVDIYIDDIRSSRLLSVPDE